MMMGNDGPFSEESSSYQKAEFAVSISSPQWASEDGNKPPRAIEILEEGNR